MTDKPRRTDTGPYWASAVIGTGTRETDDPRASDTRTTAEIIAAYIEKPEMTTVESLATIHYRGGLEEFRAGMDPRERAPELTS